MSIHCEKVTKYLLPAFRCIIAKELTDKHKMSQTEVARLLGITQASISYYLCSKRAIKGLEQYETDPVIVEAAERTAERIAAGDPAQEVFQIAVCSLCRRV